VADEKIPGNGENLERRVGFALRFQKLDDGMRSVGDKVDTLAQAVMDSEKRQDRKISQLEDTIYGAPNKPELPGLMERFRNLATLVKGLQKRWAIIIAIAVITLSWAGDVAREWIVRVLRGGS